MARGCRGKLGFGALVPRETDLPAEDAVRAGKRNESGEIEGTREAGVYSEIKFS